jgi:hypothetical protein
LAKLSAITHEIVSVFLLAFQSAQKGAVEYYIQIFSSRMASLHVKATLDWVVLLKQAQDLAQ